MGTIGGISDAFLFPGVRTIPHSGRKVISPDAPRACRARGAFVVELGEIGASGDRSSAAGRPGAGNAEMFSSTVRAFIGRRRGHEALDVAGMRPPELVEILKVSCEAAVEAAQTREVGGHPRSAQVRQQIRRRSGLGLLPRPRRRNVVADRP